MTASSGRTGEKDGGVYTAPDCNVGFDDPATLDRIQPIVAKEGKVARLRLPAQGKRIRV
jgi:hypothetical protein